VYILCVGGVSYAVLTGQPSDRMVIVGSGSDPGPQGGDGDDRGEAGVPRNFITHRN
jgi:hypothetical protein